MIASSQQIQELRDAFLQKLEKDGAPDSGGFHEADIGRIKNSDQWLKRFLEHNDLDQKLSLAHLWDTCDWRKKFGTNEINESNIRMDYIKDGGFFPHNRDIDGKALLIFKSKKHVKGQCDMEDLKRCLVYWVDRLEREEDGDQITIFFDMADTGLNNMDMDFTKYIIGLFKSYYPNFLNFIVIYEMPWILNAAFKIIKSLLPAKAVAKMKFVNKNSLKDIVPPERALSCWGGQDSYEYSFVSEVRKRNIYNYSPSSTITTPTAATLGSAATVTNNFQSNVGMSQMTAGNKKVHFADGSPMSEASPNFVGDRDSGEMLSITPADAITFTKDGNEMTGSISLTNIDENPITYKIKTTSPEKFRVRPSTGQLTPGASVTINVVLQAGYYMSGFSKDKFLVMSISLGPNADPSPQELSDMWKNTASHNVEQHRLKCILPGGGDVIRNGSITGGDSENKISPHVQNMLTQLTENNEKLQNQVKFTQTLQWVTMGLTMLLAIATIYILRVELRSSSQQFCMADPQLKE